jgi:hypothetical protein
MSLITPFNYATNSGSSVTSITATAPAASTIGDTVIVGIFTHHVGGTARPGTIADNAAVPNTYVPIGLPQQVSSGGTVYSLSLYSGVLLSLPSSGNLAITGTSNGGGIHITVAFFECTGPVYIDSASGFGYNSTGSGTVSAQTNINSLDTLVVAAVIGGNTLSAGSGWTMETQSASNETLLYSQLPPSGNQTFTVASLTSSYWATVIVGISPTPIQSPAQVKAFSGKILPAGNYELRGFFGLSGGVGQETLALMQAAQSWNDSRLNGVKIRVYWSSIQNTSATQYDWSYIDAALALAAQTGKGLGVTIGMGRFSPAWVLNSVPSIFSSTSVQVITGTLTSGLPQVTFVSTSGIEQNSPAVGTGIPTNTTVLSVDSDTQITLSNNATVSGSEAITFGGPSNYPLPWDPVYLDILTNFVKAFAARYDSNPNFSYVNMTGVGWNVSMDFAQSSTDNANFQALSFNGLSGLQAWFSAFNTIGEIYLKYFQNTAVIVDFADPLHATKPQVNGQSAVNAFNALIPPGRWGIQYNNLTGGFPIQIQTPSAIISQMSPVNPVGFQFQFANAASGGGYAAGIANGLSFGTHFIESYDAEILADPVNGPLALANASMTSFVAGTQYAAGWAKAPVTPTTSFAFPYKSTTHGSVLFSVARRMGLDPNVTMTTPVAEAYLTYIDERCREAWERFDWTDLVIYERRAFEDPWQSTVAYSMGATVFDWSSMLYWTSLQVSNLNNPPSTSPTFWGAAVMTAPFIIPTNQVTYNEIGTVFNVFAADPRSYTNPNSVGWEREQAGIILYPDRVYSDSTPYGPLLVQGTPIPGQIVGYNGQFPTTVWIEYRIPYPGFATSYYSSSQTYEVGDLAFWNNDTYKSLAIQSAASPTQSPTTWQIIGFPYVLSEFVKKAAFVDALIDDGQHEKGGLEEPKAYACLDREYDKQILQQGQQSFYTVSGV